MILYFDSYITDTPLKGRDRRFLKEDVRKKSNIYRMPKKIDIAKYTLASYANIKWSSVLIRYELDDQDGYKDMDRYIKDIFPHAIIIHKRSATQEEYIKSIKLIEKLGDEWIFYSPNNDHPLIYPSGDINIYLSRLIKTAQKWITREKYVSIMYSHFSEFLNISMKGTPEHFLHGENTKILEDVSLARIYTMPNGDFSSVQIVHISLLKHWFDSTNFREQRIIRAEDVGEKVKINNQIIIAPKKELCAHFDGYEHMLGCPNEIQIDLIPPLFIPPGFFSHNIKISYGYSIYRDGWVNINPSARNYSFRDGKLGTDLKISLNEIPYFWRPRIKEIDINKKVDKELLRTLAKRNLLIKENPWKIRDQGINLKLIFFLLRYNYFKSRVNTRRTLSRVRKMLAKK